MTKAACSYAETSCHTTSMSQMHRTITVSLYTDDVYPQHISSVISEIRNNIFRTGSVPQAFGGPAGELTVLRKTH